MDRCMKGKKKGWEDITISFTHSFKKHLLSTYCVLSLVSDDENMDIK